MGLLDKTNPKATAASVRNWAVGGSIFGLILFCFQAFRNPGVFLQYWYPLAPAMILLGAGAFAIVEWQLDDDDDDISD